MGECKWTMDDSTFDYEEFWETECGNEFCFIEGGPEDNGMKYCPYCGKLIKTVYEGEQK